MKNRLLFNALIIFLISGCSNNKPEIKWNFSKDEITGKSSSPSDKLNVDIYLDATTSVMGFNSPTVTNYSTLLDDIELVVKNVWKDSDPKYFKFGTSIDTLTRTQFVEGKTNPKFYSDRFTPNQLDLDKAVANIDPKRVSIIITDLFYKGQDIPKIVSAVNDNCTKKGIEIGVLSVSSLFTGVIADVAPPVTVTGEIRPLYVLILGGKENIQKVFDAFRDKPYVNSDQKFIVTKTPLESYEIKVEKKKDKDNSAINSDQGSVLKYKDFGNVFGFRLKEKDKAAYLTFELTSNLHPAFAKFSANNIKLTAFKKTPGVKDSILTDEVQLNNVKVSGNKITGELKISSDGTDESVSYLINIGFDNTADLQMPEWVKKYDTESYTQSDPKGKTIYLKKLFTEISTYNLTCNNPKLGKFYLYIRQ